MTLRGLNPGLYHIKWKDGSESDGCVFDMGNTGGRRIAFTNRVGLYPLNEIQDTTWIKRIESYPTKHGAVTPDGQFIDPTIVGDLDNLIYNAAVKLLDSMVTMSPLEILELYLKLKELKDGNRC